MVKIATTFINDGTLPSVSDYPELDSTIILVDYFGRMVSSIDFTAYFCVGMTGVMGTILMATMGYLSIELSNSLKETLPEPETRIQKCFTCSKVSYKC